MNFKSITCAAIVIGTITGCATVRQQDLDAWVGVPVEALDTHQVFLTMPVYRTQTDSGIEIRNYVNSKDIEQCFARSGVRRGDNKYVSHSAFITCSDTRLVCNNMFYVQAGKVTRYAPTGNCYTDDSVRPQAGYLSPGARGR
ncbi:hypothetical protein ACSFA7_32135 [Variovorax sp. LT1R20]|uniref:hypothetical protein n=1 Tax=Variovorax sp. LT1R20 TaxID=3443729 RepID=UPI003F4861B5